VRAFLALSSLQEDTRAFLRRSIVETLKKVNPQLVKPPKERLTEPELENLAELVGILDKFKFTKSVLSAELGFDVDEFPKRRLHRRKHRDVEVQTTYTTPAMTEVAVSSSMERREKILDLEKKELRVREAAVQRDKENLELAKRKMETAKEKLAEQLEMERETLIVEKVKLSTELARIQELFPN
jgi:transposase